MNNLKENHYESLNINELLKEIDSLDEEGKKAYDNFKKERQEKLSKLNNKEDK